jgi:CTP synthase
VFAAIDVPHIYEVPLRFAEQKIDEVVMRKLGLPRTPLRNEEWVEMVRRIKSATEEVRIGVAGKYIELQDAYKSIYEALGHGAMANNVRLAVVRVDSEEITRENAAQMLGGLAGILIPGGFGIRGIEGKINAVRYARENKIPFFGICLGMQCAVIDFARNAAGLADAHSTEFARDTPHPVICLMEEQQGVVQKGGTMRLGAQPCVLTEGTRSAAAYGSETISERHRHRYEFNPRYRERLEAAGMVIAGTSPDGTLVEIVELADHPWFVAVQFHPEFKSKPTAAHPLFAGLVAAAVERHAGSAWVADA